MRVDYPSGMWSERDGSLLTWGKGDQTKKERFEATSKITCPVSKSHAQQIVKAGKNPDDFCDAGNTIAARTLIPEIEACIAYAKEQEQINKDIEIATLNTAIADGTAFRVAEITGQYGSELRWARRSQPGDGYADWVVFGFAGDHKIIVQAQAIRQIIKDRKSCGSFPGCENTAWEITEEEWQQIIALSAEIDTRKAEARETFEAAEAADIQNKIDTGYCFYCETWCDGDCGHYSNNPMVKYSRDLRQASREANYGIND
jgi:hypothetical protein